MKTTLAAALLSFALLPACANTTASDYATNRVNDVVDILRVNVKAGAGIGVKVEWTRFLGLGIEYDYKVWAAGLANRELAYWNASMFSWGLLLNSHDETIHSGLSDGRLSGDYGWQFGAEGGNYIKFNDENNPLDMLNMRYMLMAGIGFDLDIRVGEVIDFLVGLAQFDPANDDRPYSEMKSVEDES